MVPDVHSVNTAPPSHVQDGSTPATAETQAAGGVVCSRTTNFSWEAAGRWVICITYVGLITWLSLTPSRAFKPVLFWFPHLFPQADKLVHFLMYGFLVALVRWAMAGQGMRWRPQGLWVPVAALVYGGLMEVAQLLLLPADRSFEVWDMVANGMGALVFWGACNLWSLRRLRTAPRST